MPTKAVSASGHDNRVGSAALRDLSAGQKVELLNIFRPKSEGDLTTMTICSLS